MGKSYGTLCKSCGNEEEYMLGFGFMSNPSFEYLNESIKSKVIKRHLHVLEKNYKGMIVDVPSLELFKCPTCKTLHSRLQFKVYYSNDKIFEPQYSCGKCKSILIPIELTGNYMGEDSEPIGYNCKKCGKETLERSLSSILWD